MSDLGYLRMAVVDASGFLVGIYILSGEAELALNVPEGGQAVDPPPEGVWDVRWLNGEWTAG